MKANFMFAIAAIMLTQNVIAMPVEDTIEVIEPTEPTEPIEFRNETEVHTVELERGQERVEVHHGRFRVRLNFKDHNSTSTVAVAVPTPTSVSMPHKDKDRNRNRGGRS
jgi:microcompartment protein CcmL/EutN